jgi:hypothetical protein
LQLLPQLQLQLQLLLQPDCPEVLQQELVDVLVLVQQLLSLQQELLFSMLSKC